MTVRKHTQLALFESPAESVRRSGRPPDVERRWNLAFSPEVKAEILQIIQARPMKWLSWKDFRVIIEKYKIGFCLGQVLSSLAQSGQIEVKKVYLGRGIGADRPGSGNYEGYTHNYRAVEAVPA